MPFCVVRALLAQAASPRPVLLRQKSQIGDVAVIESHPFLHVGGEEERNLRGTACGILYMFFSSAPPEHSETWWAAAHSWVPIHSCHTNVVGKEEEEEERMMKKKKKKKKKKKRMRVKSESYAFSRTDPGLRTVPQRTRRRLREASCSSWARAAHDEDWGDPAHSLHTRTHSILLSQREEAQSRDRPPPTPWTATHRERPPNTHARAHTHTWVFFLSTTTHHMSISCLVCTQCLFVLIPFLEQGIDEV